jgi:transposase
VLAWVSQLPGTVAVTYEAGPTGFGLARAFAAAGIRCEIRCEVVAPSKLQRPPGDRVKTDRRDARRLARLLHIGEIGGIRVPTVMEEDARDLVRARDQARSDLMRARNRLSKLLLRHGIVYCGGSTWNGVHERWTPSQVGPNGWTCPAPEPHSTRPSTPSWTVLAVTARRARLDAAITAMAAQPSGPQWAPMVARLGAIRGISTLTGLGLTVEIGDWHRFTGASIGAYLGLPRPSPHRVLQRHDQCPGIDHQDRQQPRPPAAGRGILAPPQAPTPRGQGRRRPPRRLAPRCSRPRTSRRPPPASPVDRHAGPREEPSIIAVAIARELAGWCWSLATLDTLDT